MTPPTLERAANGGLTGHYRRANGGSETREHRHGVRRLADRLEAELLVERRLLARRAETDRVVAVGAGAVEQRGQHLGAGAVAAAARHDGERQLGRPLVDEAETRRALAEQPIPRGAGRV